ncbi:hypothetical protein F511_03187 [Dorcoceras hygrometricum]|uniref:Uncharacterized protein n=1 Tax=Dorcoceras hygrometricum TaxID=472368 RepID=A0A2Z7CTU9_9LAMI|nr:hypothetical protein F511_03187 [Dorcoceras hygrometricum]
MMTSAISADNKMISSSDVSRISRWISDDDVSSDVITISSDVITISSTSSKGNQQVATVKLKENQPLLIKDKNQTQATVHPDESYSV